MPKVKVEDIVVGRRQRTSFGDIDGLAVSIQKYGLIHPICIDKNMQLIAGERRLRAHVKLGIKEIEVKYLEDLDDVAKKEIELEENIQRKELEWQEQVAAKLELHELRKQLHGAKIRGHGDGVGWGLEDTALALDESMGTVSMDLQLAKAIQMFPELCKESSKTTAFKKYKRLQEVLLRKELEKRKVREINPNVIHGDAFVELKKMEDECMDFFVTDPPFGKDLDKKSDKGKTISGVTYDDDPYKIMDMLRKVAKEMYRVLKPNRHLIIAFDMMHFTELKQILEEAGFTVHPTPLIWNKLSGSSPANGEFFPYAYEPAFWCMKGKRGLNSTACNVFTYKRVPISQKKHPLERPQGLMAAWIEAVSFPGETGCDCFAGGGSFVEACITTGRIPVAIEKDENNYLAIMDRLEDIKEREGKKKPLKEEVIANAS